MIVWWCRRRDSNSHSFRHYPLKIACLPISPRRPICLLLHSAPALQKTARHSASIKASCNCNRNSARGNGLLPIFILGQAHPCPTQKRRVTPCAQSLARRRRVTGDHGSGIAAGRRRRCAGSRRCCASRRSRCRTGCRRCSRGQSAQHAGRARGIGTVAVIGQYQRAGKKDGCQHGCCAREECGAARRAEQAAGCAAAECCASCGPFALLHEDQTDHDQGADDLNHQQDIEKYIHEKSESYGMCFTCSSTQRRAFYFAAATMAKKASALSDAPPISPPSMSGCANSSAALPAFMLPPYRMRIEFA